MNNLHTETEKIDYELAERISDLIKINYSDSNNGEYTEEELRQLMLNKTAENIFNFMCKGLSVIIYEGENVIGFGMIVRKNNLYEAKYLNVSPKFKGAGIGSRICELREQTLKGMGIRELYIESLRFKKTISFHKYRGFYDVPNIRKLYFTKYMKKDL